MHSSKLLPIFVLAITALAAVDIPAGLSNPPQRRSLKKFTLAKRQNGGNVEIGASCSAITGNPDDVICEISGEDVSCAPVCCQRDGMFVDGCPAGDQCVFEGENLKCCPVGKTCGARPTACANFGLASAQTGLVICPSATPTCTTRTDGGIACTGEGQPEPTMPPATTPTSGGGRIIRPNVPNPTDAVATPEPSSMGSTEGGDDMEATSSGRGEDVVQVSSRREGIPSGTLVLPESAMPTEDGEAVSGGGNGNVGSGAGTVVCDHVFGVVVAVVVGLGLFL
ncbi:hypothetical protein TWF192_011254 [Orbilia oligospora]|uniref:Uncharacterized protein n=1 Tax=Orbilia oligospora TaxID=2813651 RepID=A0A6G1LWJ0_ORBOL|nr:hypothetical protein TWF679_000167 [Orbilia oligospora]KAF3230882.1 hypothetical protein TWF191_008723 [Orbilia oligospora]KAF3236932.1 hypothetical protein TWF192_011254 [Orbilia oligospora]